MNNQNGVLLYGAGGIAKDIIALNEIEKQIEILGIIDDNNDEKLYYKIPVYSLKAAELKFKNKFNLIITLGDPIIKKKILRKVMEKNRIELKNYISSNSIILSKRIGTGVIIYPYCFLGKDSIISDNTLICGNVSIGHDTVIKELVTISFNTSIGGKTKINKETYIGSGTNIRDEIEIGKNVVIGMGSIVLKSIEDKKIYFNEKFDLLNENNLKEIF